jgi:phospholipase/carboxylesterase
VTHRLTRRSFTLTAISAAAAAACCNVVPVAAQSSTPNASRLTARPRSGAATTLTSGPLDLAASGRDGVIQMPAAVPQDTRLPLLLFLHGATQNGAAMLRRIGDAASAAGVVVLAPDSRDGTWDGIRGDFAEDVVFLNRALDHVFERAAIDPNRMAIGGFSDGASYGLSLGLANGDLFPRVVACSPGFIIQAPPQGKPRLFFSHGTSDQILPIDRCSRVMVPRLRTMGYDVTFREFEGRHELPPAIAAEAVHWMTA